MPSTTCEASCAKLETTRNANDRAEGERVGGDGVWDEFHNWLDARRNGTFVSWLAALDDFRNWFSRKVG